MTDHNCAKLGDKNGEHWAINAQVFAVHVEKGEMNIYSNKNIAKMEDLLASRAMPQQCEIRRSLKPNEEIRDNGSLKDSSSTASDSGGTFSSGAGEAGPGMQNEKQTKGPPKSPSFMTR